MVQATPFLNLFGTVVLGLHAVWQARVAMELIDAGAGSDDDVKFYRGKIANARFYAKNVLPGLAMTRKLVEAGDLDLMELPDDSW